MYNSIQHFNEFGVKKIENEIKNFMEGNKNIVGLILALQKILFELGRDIITEVLENMDEYLRNSGVRKKKWEIVRKDKNRILTSI